MDHHRPPVPAARGLQHPVERLALALPSEQMRSWDPRCSAHFARRARVPEDDAQVATKEFKDSSGGPRRHDHVHIQSDGGSTR